MKEYKNNKVQIHLKFDDKYKYKKTYNNVKNKDFVKCCDLLLLKEYDQFEKLIKREYWSMDNYIMFMDTINTDDIEHYNYISQYIRIDRKIPSIMNKNYDPNAWLWNLQSDEVYILQKYNIFMHCCNNNLKNLANYMFKNYIYNSNDNSLGRGRITCYFTNSMFHSKNLEYIKFVVRYNNKITIRNIRHIWNNIETLEWVLKNTNIAESYSNILKNIRDIESTKTLDLIYKYAKKHISQVDTLTILIENNNIIMINWCLNNNFKLHYSLYEAASNRNSLNIMKLLYKNGCNKIYKETMYNAIKNNNLEMVEWLIDKNTEYSYKNLQNVMIYDINKLIIKKVFYYVLHYNEINQSIGEQKIEWVDLLLSQCIGDRFNYSLIDSAVRLQSYDAMEHLYKNNYKYNHKTLIQAIYNNDLDQFKWLRGYRYNEEQKEMIYSPKLLKLNQYEQPYICKFHSCLYSSAVIKNNLKFIKWLKLNNCPMEKDTFSKAVNHGNMEIIKWLLEHNFPYRYGKLFHFKKNNPDIEWLKYH